MEPQVLEGFWKTICQYKPVIYIELNWTYCSSSSATFDACEKLIEIGYKCFKIQKDLLVEHKFTSLAKDENLDVFFLV